MGCSVQPKPSVVPPQVPVRNWEEPHLLLEHAVHAKPLVEPEQAPLRNMPSAHAMLLQVVHFPLLVLEAPSRYWPLLQVGWSSHA